MKKFLEAAFLVVAIITILEFLLVQGMFTSLIVMALSCVVGVANIAASLKQKYYNEAALYAIATIALNMGYLVIMMQYE